MSAILNSYFAEFMQFTQTNLKVLVEKKFAHFSTQSFHCIIIMISMNKYVEKTKKKFPPLVSMEMEPIFDFRALTKVHITSKPLLQMW